MEKDSSLPQPSYIETVDGGMVIFARSASGPLVLSVYSKEGNIEVIKEIDHLNSCKLADRITDVIASITYPELKPQPSTQTSTTQPNLVG